MKRAAGEKNMDYFERKVNTFSGFWNRVNTFFRDSWFTWHWNSKPNIASLQPVRSLTKLPFGRYAKWVKVISSNQNLCVDVITGIAPPYAGGYSCVARIQNWNQPLQAPAPATKKDALFNTIMTMSRLGQGVKTDVSKEALLPLIQVEVIKVEQAIMADPKHKRQMSAPLLLASAYREELTDMENDPIHWRAYHHQARLLFLKSKKISDKWKTKFSYRVYPRSHWSITFGSGKPWWLRTSLWQSGSQK